MKSPDDWSSFPHLVESPSWRTHLMKTKAFIQRGRIAFLPPSFPRLIRTHWGFSGHCTLPSAVCLEVGSTPALMASNSAPTSWYTSPLRLSHRSQNPSPWKIRLFQDKGNGHGFRAYILKYKDSLRGLSVWPLLWFVFTSQPGLLIPQLSAWICNKLCCGLFFFSFETLMKVSFLALFSYEWHFWKFQNAAQHSDFMKSSASRSGFLVMSEFQMFLFYCSCFICFHLWGGSDSLGLPHCFLWLTFWKTTP